MLCICPQAVQHIYGDLYEIVDYPARGFAFQLHGHTVKSMARYTSLCNVYYLVFWHFFIFLSFTDFSSELNFIFKIWMLLFLVVKWLVKWIVVNNYQRRPWSVCLFVCLSVCSVTQNKWSQSVQTWYREWPWDILQVTWFWGRKVNVRVSVCHVTSVCVTWRHVTSVCWQSDSSRCVISSVTWHRSQFERDSRNSVHHR